MALLGLLCLVFLRGCVQGQIVLFSVTNLPEGLVTLEARALFNDVDTREHREFNVRNLGQTTYVFGYRLPMEMRGTLLVSVAARNDKGCLLSTGTARVDLALVAANPTNIDVPLERNPRPLLSDCRTTDPTVLRLQPVPGTPGQVRVLGWGFEQGITAQVIKLPPDLSKTPPLPLPCLPPTRTRPFCSVPEVTADQIFTPTVRRLSPTELLLEDAVGLSDPRGRLGICVVVTNPDRQSACLGTGEGGDEILSLTFAQRRYSLGRQMHPTSLVISDLDGDGRNDLAMAVLQVPDDAKQPVRGVAAVLLNQGGGLLPSRQELTGELLAQPQQFPVGTSASSVVAADLNKDRRIDLVVAEQDANRVAVLLNQGPPALFGGRGPRYFPAGPKPDALTTADLEVEWRTDLILVNEPGGSNLSTTGVSVLRGIDHEEPAFSFPESYFAGVGLFSVAVGDFDRRNGPDLIVNTVVPVVIDGQPQADRVRGGLYLLRNQGGGVFPSAPREYQELARIWNETILVNGIFGTVVVADLDGKSGPDLVTSGASQGNHQEAGSVVNVLLNDGTGAFPQVQEYPAGKSPFSLAVADFNGDRRLDIVATNIFFGAEGYVTVLLQQTPDDKGNIYPLYNLPTYPMGHDSGAVAIGDLNGDSKPDMVVANFGTIDRQDPRRSQPGSVTVYLNTTR